MDLTPSLYEGMRRRAARMLVRWRGLAEAPELSSLVDETCLKLLKTHAGPADPALDREHFLGVWTKAMRSVLVDLARARRASKRGGEREREELCELVEPTPVDLDEILDVHEALNRLAAIDARDATIVELRYYGGCTWDEVARAVGGSAMQLKNEWRAIRASLRQIMLDRRS